MATIIGGSGSDTISPVKNTTGGALPTFGNDRIEGLGGNDFIAGHFGADTLLGGLGADTLIGQFGNDVLSGGPGADILRGEEGDDRLLLSSLSAAEQARYDGGTGTDTFDATSLGAGLLRVDLQAGIVAFGGNPATLATVGTIAPGSIENLLGSALGDILVGDGAANDVRGFGGNDTITGGGGDDLLSGDAGDDALQGGDGADTLDGGEGNSTQLGGAGGDVMTGGGGRDILFGGTEGDTLTGAGGIDSLEGEAGDDLIDAGAENDVLGGGAGRDTLLAGDGDDRLVGGTEDDLLAGHAGNDTLLGEAGNDTLHAGAGFDRLDGGEGFDTADYGDLTGPVQILVTEGGFVQANGAATSDLLFNVEAISGTAFGDSFTALGPTAMLLRGMGGNDQLEGGFGDTLDGGEGSDTFIVADATTVVVEDGTDGAVDLVWSLVDHVLVAGAENLSLFGNANIGGTGNTRDNLITGQAGNNLLGGLDGADTLFGDAGADTMVGGAGNDLYFVHDSDDVVIDDAAGEGLVIASASFTLGGTLRNLVQAGDAGIDATGNAAGNRIAGNAGDNQLSGLGGDDDLFGGIGNGLLLGGNGADTLEGGTGADTLSGGAGDDLYILRDDAVVLMRDFGGFDRVESQVSVTLATGMEVLVLLGVDPLSGTGSSDDNLLLGNGGANRLSGGAGADTLAGGEGADTLFGGAGADVFLFGSAPGPGQADRIGGFTAEDGIAISLAAFDPAAATGLSAGLLSAQAGRFASNLTGLAATAETRLTYEADAGRLWWDADGTGAGARLLVATLAGQPGLIAADITLIG
jgi:serralysin